jgi:hypothetical protein
LRGDSGTLAALFALAAVLVVLVIVLLGAFLLNAPHADHVLFLSGWTAAIFGSRACARTIAGVDEVQFWTRKLREAEAELDAAKTRTALHAAAKKLQRARAALKALQAEAAEKPKRRSSRGSRSAMLRACLDRLVVTPERPSALARFVPSLWSG